MKLTILTPSYNRAHTLPRLFASLQRQSCKDFCWLIVDDGSSDNTGEIAESFAQEADFPVEYLRKENGGRHSAINAGMAHVKTELVFPVDSDDLLLPKAVEEVLSCYQRYEKQQEIGVFSFQRCNEQGSIETPLPWKEAVSDFIQCRIRENRAGNMAEVFRREALLRHPFPEFPGERFLSEDITWIDIAKEYRCVFSNTAIYQAEYLEDGLTRSDKKVKFASPQGSMLRGKQLMDPLCGFKANLKGAIIYDCYRREAQKHSSSLSPLLTLSCRQKLLTLLLRGAGGFYYRKWKREAAL